MCTCDSSMVAVQVGTVCRVVCASPGYLASHGKPKAPADLGNFDCVNFEALPSGPICYIALMRTTFPAAASNRSRTRLPMAASDTDRSTLSVPAGSTTTGSDCNALASAASR
jgi:DNA-binding transcriptional LysR family regulator